MFDRVQTQLSGQAIARYSQSNAPSPSLLKGMVFDATGDALHITQAAKGSRRYRYYVSSRRVYDPDNNQDGLRLPAEELEALVGDAILDFLSDYESLEKCIGPTVFDDTAQTIIASDKSVLRSVSFEPKNELISLLVASVLVGDDSLTIVLNITTMASRLGISDYEQQEHRIVKPIAYNRQRNERKLVLVGEGHSPNQGDNAMCRLIAKSHLWITEMMNDNSVTIDVIAERENMNKGDVCRQLPLAFLAPDIVEAILGGRQPNELTSRTLRRARPIPEIWADQRRFLGFPSII